MSKVAKAAVGLMIVTILSKIIGFAREQVLSFVYGASMYTDIYFVTMNIPNVPQIKTYIPYFALNIIDIITIIF